MKISHVQDVCARSAHRRHPPGHVPEAGTGAQGRQGLLQVRRHLQHGRVCRDPRGPPRELSQVRVSGECRQF